jgi:hemerythrin-like metal-binding protein
MEKAQWREELSVGVPLIDEQHRMLLKRISDLSDAVRALKGPGEIVSTLSFLIDYTGYHFSTEERHMAANAYPGLEEHKAKHQDFNSTLAGLEEDFREEGATTALADSINTLLGHWLVEHIQDVDQRFGDFLRERGITIEEES